MVNFCAIVSWGHKHGKNDVSFFRLPTVNLRNSIRIQTLQQKRRKAWLAAIKRADLTEKKLEFGRVCSNHFISGKPADLDDENNPDWVPCINLGYKKNTNQKSMDRFNRSKRRLKTKSCSSAPLKQVESATTQVQMESAINTQVQMESSTSQEQIESCTSQEQDETANVLLNDTIEREFEVDPLQCNCPERASLQVEVQTELKQSMIQAMEDDLKTVNSELYTLRQDVARLELSEDTFKENDSKVTFYTGLPNFAILRVLLNEISPFLNVTATSSLSKFQQFLLTLMKLRLNLKFIDLGYRFNVSSKTASRLFHQTLIVLSLRLKKMIFWPEREDLRKTMPRCFKEAFGTSVAIIIDCFEICIGRPANVMAKCQTWS